MALWIIALTIGVPIGGDYGGAAWHAHEMLFGYSSAALAGFLLTAIPNWTGRLPVSGSRGVLPSSRLTSSECQQLSPLK
jgi:uncharacterized protein involved in response to NO